MILIRPGEIMSRILVVDDDTSLLQMMGLMLKRAGHSAILASDGHEGIEIARREQPDMAIIDIMMPDLSGYDVCSTLRKDPQTKDIPLLILTALSQHEYRKRAEASGADGFITKPVTRDDLVGNIEELLHSGARNFPEFEEEAEASSDDVALPAAAPQTSVASAPAAAASQQAAGLPLVAVVGLGSGVGATTVAVNLGLGLMQFGRSCIADLHYQAGHVSAQLNLIAKGNWSSLASVEPGGDKRQIAGTLTLEHPSGVAILAAPTSPTQARLRGDTLHYVFSVLSEGFKRIVVDLPAGLDPMNVASLQDARHIVLVIGDNPANLGNIPNAIATLQDMRLGGTVHLVLNHTRPHGVTHETVMQTLNAPLAADIPYEPAQVDAVTRGLPLIMSQPSSLFSRTILQLARQL
jgi:CheY-like chemotaxis protein/MinD-like ATPase involved in chromosome partitioning or flagellar assembly